MTDQCFSNADALMYDNGMSDWPGEIDYYYLKLANDVREKGQTVFDIACGTGRVALRLTQTGIRVVGMDLAPDKLAVANRKPKACLKSGGFRRICVALTWVSDSGWQLSR